MSVPITEEDEKDLELMCKILMFKKEDANKLIEKHLEDFDKAEFKASVKDYLKTGKISGPFKDAILHCMVDYAELFYKK